MKTSDFDYELPPELIAQHPSPDPLEARLMIVDRRRGGWTHARVADLPTQVQTGDLWVFNDTRVIPARVFGRKESSPGRVEIFFLRDHRDATWTALLRASSRRPRPGEAVVFGVDGEARAVLLEDYEKGRCRIRIETRRPLMEILAEVGEAPLPPYIHRDYAAGTERAKDLRRYQTIFAREPGAVAAPTAGLHFTPALLDSMRAAGARTATVTLHVGLGTFRPVTAENAEDHVMEPERYELNDETALALRETRASSGRIVAVGSTSTRTLETVYGQQGGFVASRGESALYIRPPHAFPAVDALLTNFHLPKSTLMMLVSAFATRELMLAAYAEAVREQYRFFSYGDAMLIV